MGRSLTFQAGVGALALGALCAAGYLFFVLTGVGQRIDNEAFFGRGGEGEGIVAMDRSLLGSVTTGFLGMGAAVLAGVAVARRRWASGIAAVVAVGMSVGGAEFLKANLPRPVLAEPGGEVPEYFARDTYPSGHTAVGCSLALGMVLVAGARWRAAISGASGLVCAAYATGVVFLGWHRPSDAVGGILWTGACFGAVAWLLLQWKGRPRGFVFRGPVAMVVLVLLGFLAMVCAWVAAGLPESPGGWAFHLMTALIVAAAFGTAGWFGRLLDGLEEI